MALDIHLFPCLSDNYAILIRDQASGLAATVDTPDAAAILAEADRLGWRLALVLNTHWHPDHAGGNQAIKDATGAEIVGPPEVTRIAPLDRPVVEGDGVFLGDTRLSVIDTRGHTNGHLSYYAAEAGAVFVGDTLFALGCGRLFEGTAQDMWTSLGKLTALPDDTQVYCAHEYTASNARFALSVDPDPQVAARCEAVFAARADGRPTVPTSIALEKATNPFLRAPLLAAALGTFANDAEAFGLVRAAKDGFRG
jgi:hydroxyacylglutathione hydrolase